ncbi:MAG: hypothetical protein AAGD96_36100, partial [Chloroflexota bacterium]
TANQNLENVLQRLPQNDRYSFNFGGASQLIDGILLTKPLAEELDSIAIQHLNADYPDTYQLSTASNRLAFKSTDHDPAIAIFNHMPEIDEAVKTEIIENAAAESQSVDESNIQSNFDYRWFLIPMAFFLIVTGWVIISNRRSR